MPLIQLSVPSGALPDTARGGIQKALATAMLK